MVSGTVHATPRSETFVLVIELATYRVLARSASGCVQPAAGRAVAAGAVPATAAPRLDGHAVVLEPLPPPLEQPPSRPAATTKAAPATASRRPIVPPAALTSSPIAHHSPCSRRRTLSHHAGTAGRARGRGETTHTPRPAPPFTTPPEPPSPPLPHHSSRTSL